VIWLTQEQIKLFPTYISESCSARGVLSIFYQEGGFWVELDFFRRYYKKKILKYRKKGVDNVL